MPDWTREYNHDSIILDGPQQTEAFHLLAQYHACRLHLIGMRHSSGRSIIAHVKRTYDFKGANKSVVEQFRQLLIEKEILKP
jgi:hypothetical protein